MARIGRGGIHYLASGYTAAAAATAATILAVLPTLLNISQTFCYEYIAALRAHNKTQELRGIYVWLTDSD